MRHSHTEGTIWHFSLTASVPRRLHRVNRTANLTQFRHPQFGNRARDLAHNMIECFPEGSRNLCDLANLDVVADRVRLGVVVRLRIAFEFWRSVSGFQLQNFSAFHTPLAVLLC